MKGTWNSTIFATSSEPITISEYKVKKREKWLKTTHSINKIKLGWATEFTLPAFSLERRLCFLRIITHPKARTDSTKAVHKRTFHYTCFF